MLTQDTAKPAVPFGGKYRIIDSTVQLRHSGIDTVGAHQYQPWNSTITSATASLDLKPQLGGAHVLPPYTQSKTESWYKARHRHLSE